MDKNIEHKTDIDRHELIKNKTLIFAFYCYFSSMFVHYINIYHT